MPDLPDKGRPSSPLTAEDADRLADSFTAFWEDAEAPATSEPVAAAAAPNAGAVTAPMPAVQSVPAPMPAVQSVPTPMPAVQSVPTPAPVVQFVPASTLGGRSISAPPPAVQPVTAPMPAAQAVPAQKPIGKQTLLGIAPITIEKPAAAEPNQKPAPTEPVQKLAAARPSQTPAPAEPVQKLAATEPSQTPAPGEAVQKLASAEPIPKPTPSEPIQSSPGVPGYAIAYTPKDHPGTPAVVIAPEAQSSPENKPPERRREFSQTMPSRVRSAPTASVAPLPPPVAVDDFNPYAPKKSKGKVVGWTLAGLVVVLLSVAFVRSFGSASHQTSAQSAARIDVMPAAPSVAAAPTPAPADEALTPQATAAPTAAKEPASPAVASRRASEPSPAKTKVKAKVKAEPAVATRPATRAPTSEPSPSPVRPASKGVIVRDAPF